jgi:hypothetical protein
MRRLRQVGFLVVTTLMLAAAAMAQGKFQLKAGDRVVFYLDSVTDQRLYTTFVETYVVTRFPRLRVGFVHSGWGGDRVTGGGGGADANNTVRQSEAMMAIDVSAPFGGSMEQAAAAVKAKTLVVVAKFDHVVTPGPTTEFARLMHAELLELDSDCVHMAPSCEEAKVRKAVAEFLER